MWSASAKLWTATTVEPSQSHRCTSTDGWSAFTTCQSPKPSSGVSLRRRISRSIQVSSESRRRRASATLTRVGPVVAARHRRREPVGRAGREPPAGLVGPLHRRAHGPPVGDVEVLAHADLLAVEQHRRAGQGEQQAVGHLDAGRGRRRASSAAGGAGPGRRAASTRRARRRRSTPPAPRRSAGRGSARRGCAGTTPTASRTAPAAARRAHRRCTPPRPGPAPARPAA